jgi:hypothetical protein
MVVDRTAAADLPAALGVADGRQVVSAVAEGICLVAVEATFPVVADTAAVAVGTPPAAVATAVVTNADFLAGNKRRPSGRRSYFWWRMTLG